MKKEILFIDLDDTLIETVYGKTFPVGIWDMKFKSGILDAIKKFAPKQVIIVSNQGGIEYGFVKESSFFKKIAFISQCIEDYAEVPATFSFSKTNSKTDKRRKPNTGMYLEHKHNYIENKDFSDKQCLMVGDASGKEGQFSDSDKMFAINCGIDYMDVEDFILKYDV